MKAPEASKCIILGVSWFAENQRINLMMFMLSLNDVDVLNQLTR